MAEPYTVALAGVGLVKGVYEVFKPELSAKRAWAAIGLGVLAYELACPQGELLSEGADVAVTGHPYLTRAAIGITALHLANIIPERYDPIHQLVKTFR